jgi:hypothetical protein
MPLKSYRLRRTFWLVWKWEVESSGRVVGRGVSLTRPAARWAARARLRALRSDATPSPPVKAANEAA